MSGPHVCAGCGRALSRDEPYWRFALALEGELDSLSAGSSGKGTGEDLEALVGELEDRDPDELENEVHEELEGVLCSPCRARLRNLLRRTSSGTPPH